MLAAFRPCLLVCGVVGLRTNAVASADDIDPTAIDEYVIARMQAARIPGLAVAIVRAIRSSISKATAAPIHLLAR